MCDSQRFGSAFSKGYFCEFCTLNCFLTDVGNSRGDYQFTCQVRQIQKSKRADRGNAFFNHELFHSITIPPRLVIRIPSQICTAWNLTTLIKYGCVSMLIISDFIHSRCNGKRTVFGQSPVNTAPRAAVHDSSGRLFREGCKRS